MYPFFVRPSKAEVFDDKGERNALFIVTAAVPDACTNGSHGVFSGVGGSIRNSPVGKGKYILGDQDDELSRNRASSDRMEGTMVPNPRKTEKKSGPPERLDGFP